MQRALVLISATIIALALACGDSPSGSTSSGSGGGSSSGGASSGASSGGGSSGFSATLQSGVVTFYDADGSGNCGFDPSPNDLDVAAFDFPEYAGSASCGSCVRIAGPLGQVTVRIVDSCPGCENHHIDLSQSAFAKIADPVQGKVAVTYQTVACDVSGNIAYHFKDGSSKFWTAIQIRNHRLPVAKLEYRQNGAYVEIARVDYNYFIVDSGVGDQPGGLALRVTAADGQTLEDTLPGAIPSNQTVSGAANFK